MSDGRMQGRVALVTGASRGIGRAVAMRYAEEGAELVLLARTQAALEELDDEIRSRFGRQSTLVPLDIKDSDALDRLGAALWERHKRLDVLVGNAGVLGVLGPMSHCKPKDWDDVIATNLTANWRLIRSMEPLLRQSEAGRAIFVTSGVGSTPVPYWGPYGISKAGLEMMVKTWAAEMTKTALKANLVDPGAVGTRMRAKAFPGEKPEGLPRPEDVMDVFVELALPSCMRNGEVVKAR